MRPVCRAFWLFLVLFLGAVSATAQSDAKQLYQRCAACHLPDGVGISGSFPPLKNRIRPMASSDLGRAYLVNVINVGLIGPISVGAVAYMGVMPAQGSSYTAADISDLLNYMARELDDGKSGENWRQFSESEVQQIIDRGTAEGGHDTARQRAALIAAFPELQ
jgi:mono/diheme cytochrome c family protein|tara:strand:- start:9678 stop:10166 length:489 start_codon:yes stop_codon:yes gene_type:complete